MVAALMSEDATLQTVNVGLPGGLVEERQAWVSSHGFEPQPEPTVNGVAGRWLSIYRAHEEAMLSCVRKPGRDTIGEALRADPVVRSRDVRDMANALWESYENPSTLELCRQ
jgi:hypothetical protein